LGGVGECDEVRFGGTEYAKVILNELWGLPPALDMDYEKRVHDAMREIVAAGLAESAHDVSDGGLAVAAAECCFGRRGRGADFESDLSPEFPAVPRRDPPAF
jgi:phosphoribosylformylglycinamidine (FGAM) synthase-like enzyme